MRLQAPHRPTVLIDGFAVGTQYLVAAAGGTVDYCGDSGPASPDFTDAFEQAVAG